MYTGFHGVGLQFDTPEPFWVLLVLRLCSNSLIQEYTDFTFSFQKLFRQLLLDGISLKTSCISKFHESNTKFFHGTYVWGFKLSIRWPNTCSYWYDNMGISTQPRLNIACFIGTTMGREFQELNWFFFQKVLFQYFVHLNRSFEFWRLQT